MGLTNGARGLAPLVSLGVGVEGTQARTRETSAHWHEAVSVALTRSRLQELSVSKSVAIRETIAARSDCPLGIFASFAHDHRSSVTVAVAANPRSRASLRHRGHPPHGGRLPPMRHRRPGTSRGDKAQI